MKSNKNSVAFQLALVSAPEDFPPQLRSLTTLDSILRCPICKEFYQAPVLIHIPKCCHTFCSACIRTCFNNDSNNQKIRATGLGGVGNSHRCPICKVEAQEEKLKPVPTLESAVISWQDARDEILDIIKRLQSFESNLLPPPPPPSLPQPSSSSTVAPILHRPQTRSSKNLASTLKPSPATKRKSTHSAAPQFDQDDDIELLSYNPTDPSAPVKCPVCQTQMLNANMDTHITRCLIDKQKAESPEKSKRGGKRVKKSQREQDHEGTQPVQNRIPLPHFSSLKPKDIKAELAKHQLSLAGSTSVQTRRLSKYITLFNSNLDAHPSHQKSLESIFKELTDWETLQDSENSKLDQRHKKLLNNQADYLKLNKSHFDLLINQASQSLKKSSNSSKIDPLESDPTLIQPTTQDAGLDSHEHHQEEQQQEEKDDVSKNNPIGLDPHPDQQEDVLKDGSMGAKTDLAGSERPAGDGPESSNSGLEDPDHSRSNIQAGQADPGLVPTPPNNQDGDQQQQDVLKDDSTGATTLLVGLEIPAGDGPELSNSNPGRGGADTRDLGDPASSCCNIHAQASPTPQIDRDDVEQEEDNGLKNPAGERNGLLAAGLTAPMPAHRRDAPGSVRPLDGGVGRDDPKDPPSSIHTSAEHGRPDAAVEDGPALDSTIQRSPDAHGGHHPGFHHPAGPSIHPGAAGGQPVPPDARPLVPHPAAVHPSGVKLDKHVSQLAPVG